MTRLLLWIAFLLLLFGSAMMMAGIGSNWLWTAVFVVAVALLFVGQRKPRAARRR
jgi:hypothetical protein